MATILNADTISGGFIATGDSSGILQLQSSGTPSLTLNTSGAHGVGSSPSYGTSGQVLQSNGSSAAPSWVTPSSGAMSLISTQTISTATAAVSFTGLSGYDKYQLIIENCVPDTATVQLYATIGYGSTPTYLTSGYRDMWIVSSRVSSGVVTGPTAQYGNQAKFFIGSQQSINGANNSSISGNFLLQGFTYVPSAAPSGFVSLSGSSSVTDVTDVQFEQFLTNSACVTGTTPTTAIQLFFSSGNFASGKVSLYGISS